MNRVFFDNAATTPLAPEVSSAMLEAMTHLYGNPSSIHAEGRSARAAIEQARKKVAQYIGASIGEIFFTSGGTESNNTALKCAVRDLGVQRIISSPIEHHCVLHSLDTLAQHHGVAIEYLPINSKGEISLSDLQNLLEQDGRKTLVSLMHANNEIGTMIDLEAVSALCQSFGALFHTDTVQTMGYYPFDLSKLNISFLSGSAHKLHGPKGVGFLYINSRNLIKPFMDGGSQERNMRGGTENLYGIIGLARAMELAYDQLDHTASYIRHLRDNLKVKLEATFEGIAFNGNPENGHYKLLSVNFPPSERSELLLLNLDINGVSVSGGSACSSGAEAGSHVIAAIGGLEEYKTIRFSLSHYNTLKEIDYLLEKLEEILPERVKK
ncbi:MAG TPA: cysteine desulfurase family protein [Saprospiraceae bacterium]|nr:cysteine desulfurase family protein [Saprospiraceae bacterium]HMQ84784.1 cysteine desulfurase family protein [Saprospiraceae bacterium]